LISSSQSGIHSMALELLNTGCNVPSDPITVPEKVCPCN
jgi:hypothetical protein